jgi:hypothetical protein
MPAQLQRYFAAIAGGGITVAWITAGMGTALLSLAAGAGSYGAVLVRQRRKVMRRPPQVRPPRRRMATSRIAAVYRTELDVDSQPSASGTYGW